MRRGKEQAKNQASQHIVTMAKQAAGKNGTVFKIGIHTALADFADQIPPKIGDVTVQTVIFHPTTHDGGCNLHVFPSKTEMATMHAVTGKNPESCPSGLLKRASLRASSLSRTAARAEAENARIEHIDGKGNLFAFPSDPFGFGKMAEKVIGHLARISGTPATA